MASSATAGYAARARLVQDITACWRTQALHAAVQLNLPDQLAAGPQTAAGLAAACQCEVDALRRLLRALCTLEVCAERPDDHFELTEAGMALCRQPRDGGPSLHALAAWWGGPMWPIWGDLAYSVRTGCSARERQTGHADYAFLADAQPGMAALFHSAMQALTALVTADVARLPCWQGARSLVDVGGGTGELAAAVACAHPPLQVCVLDRADAMAGALAQFARHGLQSRARFVSGDFFVAIPPGADCYLLKSILHNWDDVACRRILARCAQAALPYARLLVVERLRPETMGSSRREQALARTDLNMLAGLGGRERSLAEFRALLEPAGFELLSVTDTAHEFSVIEAQRR